MAFMPASTAVSTSFAEIVHAAVTVPVTTGDQYGYRAIPDPPEAPALTGVSAVRPAGGTVTEGFRVPVTGSASRPSAMSVPVAAPSTETPLVISGAVVSLTLKSGTRFCGIPEISPISHVRLDAYPVSATDTHVTGSAFAHAQIAPRLEYPLATEMPACCHRFPALSVTLTAGTFGAGSGGVVRETFVLIVSHAIHATIPEPSLVVIGVVPSP